MTRPEACSGKALVALIAALTLAGCGAQQDAAQKPVAIVDAQTVALETFSPVLRLTGVVEARNETRLAFRITGQVDDHLVDVGDHVTKGQALATIDDAGQQADLQAAQAALNAAKAQAEVAQATFERQKSLLAEGVTTRSSFEAAETALQTAQSAQQSAQAQLDTAQDALTFTRLLAPAAGVITARNLETGEVAQAASPMFVLAEDGPRDAVFNVQEAVFLGDTDHVRIDLFLTSDPTVKATGRLREVSPALDPQTGTVLVRVAIDNPPPGMTLGGSVVGAVSASPTQKVVMPWSALWSNGGTPSVWIVDPQTRAVSLQPVTVDSYQTGSVVIQDGLKAGQVVVTQGTKLLVPGQVVTLAEETVP